MPDRCLAPAPALLPAAVIGDPAGLAALGAARCHYVFEAAGRRILYCYIRKNGCSAFKDLIVSVARAQGRPAPGDGETRKAFLDRCHRVGGADDLRDIDRAVVVLRDPVERALSLYRNKFVDGVHAEDIRASYAAITETEPRTASFGRFVRDYLSRPFKSLDPHVRPQAWSLLPIPYTDRIALADLRRGMAPVVGEALAERHFARPMNARAGARPGRDGAAGSLAEAPADALRDLAACRGRAASPAEMVTAEIEAALRRLYRKDDALTAPAGAGPADSGGMA